MSGAMAAVGHKHPYIQLCLNKLKYITLEINIQFSSLGLKKSLYAASLKMMKIIYIILYMSL